jgi:Undecaprenyl-phosphate glucose phosphotransferase
MSPLVAAVGLLACQSLAIAACAIFVETAARGGGDPTLVGRHVLIALVTASIFPSMIASIGAHGFSRGTGLLGGTLKSLALLLVAALASVGGYKILASWPAGSIGDAAFDHWFSAWFLTSAGVVAILNIGANALVGQLRKQGRLAKKIVVFGGGEHGARFIAEAAARWRERICVDAYFDDRLESARGSVSGVPCLGGTEQLVRYVGSERVDEIVIALPWSADQQILSLLAKFRHLSVPIRLAPELIALRVSGGSAAMSGMDAIPIIRDQPISEWGLFVKDTFDRVMAALLLLLALPTMAVTAGFIKWDSPGPVFFRQKRLGFNGRPFEILKFRTMTQSSNGRLALQQARRSDRRITRIGGFLRRSSLDELPQLINVLRGDMSLVGPRPHPMWTRASELWPEHGDQPLESILQDYASRHQVKPGITGWAQVRGCRGETETVDKMARRVEHDLHYIENWSLWLDLKILSLTVITVLMGDDAH